MGPPAACLPGLFPLHLEDTRYHISLSSSLPLHPTQTTLCSGNSAGFGAWKTLEFDFWFRFSLATSEPQFLYLLKEGANSSPLLPQYFWGFNEIVVTKNTAHAWYTAGACRTCVSSELFSSFSAYNAHLIKQTNKNSQLLSPLVSSMSIFLHCNVTTYRLGAELPEIKWENGTEETVRLRVLESSSLRVFATDQLGWRNTRPQAPSLPRGTIIPALQGWSCPSS